MSRLLLVLLMLVLLLLGISFYAFVAYDPQVESALDASDVLPEGAGFAPKPSMDRWKPLNRIGRRLHDWLGERTKPKLDEVKVVSHPFTRGPVGGLDVRVRQPNGDLARAVPVTVYVPAGVEAPAPQWTDHEGIARFRDLPSGPGYVVEATDEDQWIGASPSTRAGVRVDAGASLGVELMLPGQTIEGTVVDRLTGEPVPDADISAAALPFPQDVDWFHWFRLRVGRTVTTVGTARTDVDGKFALRWIPVGPVVELLAKTADGRVGLASGRLSGAELPAVRLRVGRLPPLTGVIVDEVGAPVSGALVRVASHDGQARTDSLGTFSLERPVPGANKLVVEAEGYVVSGPWIRENEPIRVRVPTPQRTALAVRVTDASGNAVPGAEVWGDARDGKTSGPGGHYSILVTTDDDGRARLPVLAGKLSEVRVAKGRMSITFEPEAEEKALYTRVLDFKNPILAGETREVRLALPLEILVRGRTVHSDGRPAAGAQINTRNGLPGAVASVAAADDGRFLLRAFQPEAVEGELPDWTVTAFIGHVASATLKLTPRLGEARGGVLDVGDVVLRSGVIVRGRVVDAEGAPVAGANVGRGYSVWSSQVVADRQGVYRYSMPVELLSVTSLPANAEGWRERLVFVRGTLVSGHVHDVEPIFLRRALRVRVHVSDPSGAPIVGARVQLKSMEQGATYSLPTTDGTGWVELAGHTTAPFSEARRDVNEVQSLLSEFTDWGNLSDSEDLLITLPDGFVLEHGIRVFDDPPNPFDVRVVAPGRLVLEGVVRDEAGASVGNASVQASFQRSTRGARSSLSTARTPWDARHAVTDATGRFRVELAAVPGESWRVSATHDDGRKASELVVLPLVAPIELVLRQPAPPGATDTKDK